MPPARGGLPRVGKKGWRKKSCLRWPARLGAAASPAAPDAAPAAPSHRAPIEPSLEADRQEFPALIDGPNVLIGCPGQQAIIEAAESLADGDQPDLELRQHAADREPQTADVIGEVGRIYRGGEEGIDE